MLLPFAAPDKEQNDSIVRLMSAQSAQQIQGQDGRNYRKVIGPARFLHNNTYLVCDTAIWDVDAKIINAFGNVQIIQDETVLSSEKLDYYIDRDVAEFRGGIVQLQDKDNNVLRTRYLDYNTKDSTAVFTRGGAMKSGDGQIIESFRGEYDSKLKTFTFNQYVNMLSDSVKIKCPLLEYRSNEARAYFDEGVHAWKDGNMLSSGSGYYAREDSIFFFTGNVHAMTEKQEVWSDSLYVYQAQNNVLLLGDAQVKDSTRKAAAMANYILYEDSLSRITLQRDAAIAGETQQNQVTDTIYFGAENIVYQTVKKCDIDSLDVKAAIARLANLSVDPVMEYRKQKVKASTSEEQEEKPAVEEEVEEKKLSPIEQRRQKLAAKQAKKNARIAAKAAKKALHDSVEEIDPLSLADTSVVEPSEPQHQLPDTLQTASAPAEALQDSIPAPLDTTVRKDTIVKPLDTTKIGYIFATGKVRAFRKDLQLRCDSLIYTDLDSLARLFKEPMVWNAGNRQYSSDSISILIQNSRIDKASLTSNAFVVIKEDTVCYDQIRGTEIMAYFDSLGNLSRFDALGGASAVFYIEENDALATANKVETKMLSAILDSGQVQKIHYYDNPKNNAYPTMQLPKDDKQMKGFKWNPENRPKGKEDITKLVLKDSERSFYNREETPNYPFTRYFFPGYIESLEEAEDSVADTLAQKPQEPVDIQEKPVTDQPEPDVTVTSKPEPGSEPEPEAVIDSVETSPEIPVDSVFVPMDKWEERALKRMERQEEREKRWAELDARDAQKAAEKAEAKQAKKRQRTLKQLRAAEKEAAKDQKKLDRYIKRYQKQQARQSQRTAAEYSR